MYFLWLLKKNSKLRKNVFIKKRSKHLSFIKQKKAIDCYQ